jgi:hypothetical protein
VVVVRLKAVVSAGKRFLAWCGWFNNWGIIWLSDTAKSMSTVVKLNGVVIINFDLL